MPSILLQSAFQFLQASISTWYQASKEWHVYGWIHIVIHGHWNIAETSLLQVAMSLSVVTTGTIFWVCEIYWSMSTLTLSSWSSTYSVQISNMVLATCCWKLSSTNGPQDWVSTYHVQAMSRCKLEAWSSTSQSAGDSSQGPATDFLMLPQYLPACNNNIHNTFTLISLWQVRACARGITCQILFILFASTLA
jgi:hypothetical protein